LATLGHFVLPVIAGLHFNLNKLEFVAMLFFALLPDIDVLLSFAFTGNPFTLHRGFTHSLLFALLPLAIYIFVRRTAFLWGFVGALSHPLIDLLDTNGCPLFWPFSNNKYGLGLWHSTSITDVSISSLVSPSLFISDKLLFGLLILYLTYYLVSRWFCGSIKCGCGKPVEKRNNQNKPRA